MSAKALAQKCSMSSLQKRQHREMSSTEQIFTNATLVLPDETKVGTLVIKDGLIRDISFENTSMPRAEDLNKNYLLPTSTWRQMAAYGSCTLARCRACCRRHHNCSGCSRSGRRHSHERSKSHNAFGCSESCKGSCQQSYITNRSSPSSAL